MTFAWGVGAESVAHYTQRYSKLARRWSSKVPPYWSVDVLNEWPTGNAGMAQYGKPDEVNELLLEHRRHIPPL